ncbi:hypothetical protein OPV22_028909 [Ensete ventricosum]|uniref:NAC domain-containing protein n=1 Tax=Ensete ventricosum TaxID=4639 RepID=A0AAV8PZP2_ENSVE|nr:hypothetical protein OPV22_028909 [Ensete ventricosum]
MSNPTSLPPGFRFHPTDEELILHYLRNRAASMPCPVSIIAEVDIYKFDPWELPAKALFGDREWYFFSPRDRKYPNGVRPNRAASSGYWKATGTDKPIVASKGMSDNIGVKKALVFYKGKPPKGVKTDWIMHEYRLAEALRSNDYHNIKLRGSSMRLDDWVLCRIYKKSNHQLPLDAEQEGTAGVEAASPHGMRQNSFLKLPKSYSLTELLDAADYSTLARLLENPPDVLGSQNCWINYPESNPPPFIPHCNQPELAVPINDRVLKRKQMVNSSSCCFEEDDGFSFPAKKPTVPRTFDNAAALDSLPYPLLLSSDLGSQLAHGAQRAKASSSYEV